MKQYIRAFKSLIKQFANSLKSFTWNTYNVKTKKLKTLLIKELNQNVSHETGSSQKYKKCFTWNKEKWQVKKQPIFK